MDSKSSMSSHFSLKVSKKKEPGAFASYFQTENQKQCNRLDKRRAAEDNLMAVLQPIQFSEEEEERLRELKAYKCRKRMQQDRYRELMLDGMPPIAGNVADRTVEALHHHTWKQRFSIVSALMILLFISIHADRLGEKVLPDRLFPDNSLVPWYIIVLKDCGKLCHMSACSLIHFALCDISLIYAFEAMDLSSKTGPKVKEFYRANVHVAVAAMSGGILAFSICKALLLAWFRVLRDLLETVMDIISLGINACEAFFRSLRVLSNALSDGLPKIVHAALATPPSEWVTSVWTGLARLLTGLWIWILAVVIPFDAKERLPMGFGAESPTFHPENAMRAVTNIAGEEPPEANTLDNKILADTLARALNRTLNETLNSQAIPTTVQKPLTWRADSVETFQWLLSHSAFFLVTLLMSMHFLIRSYRHKTFTAEDDAVRRPATFPDDQSSIQTSPSLARDETVLVANYSTDTSMETNSTLNPNSRPTSITVTITSESVTSNSHRY